MHPPPRVIMHPPPRVIVEISSVAPLHGTTTSSPTQTSLPLTFFDIVWLRFPPAECLYFYELPNPTTSSFYNSILPNLKHSLALTLQHFLPLAGNITWPLESSIPTINYVPGDSVSFTVTESQADFNHLCSDSCEAAKRHHLIPHMTTSHEKASLLALQVTLFPNFGFCIGITAHHAAMDGKSSTMFMKAWAYLFSNPSLSSLPEYLTPFFNRSVIIDTDEITEAYLDMWLKQSGPNNRSLKVWESVNTKENDAVKSSFELTPSHVQKLKKYAQSKLKDVKIHLSTFSVTSAYVLACLVKTEKPRVNKVIFIFGVDCRTKLDPAILPTYFGNCIMGQKVEVEMKKLLENDDGFISALEGISEALNGVKKGELLKGAKSFVSGSFENDRVYSPSGSPRIEVYSIDFGCRPKKVDLASIDRTGAFSLSESRNNNGGIEIGLTLNKHEMEAFSALFVQGLDSFQV